MFVGWLLKIKELENFGAESNEHFEGRVSRASHPVENKGLIQGTSRSNLKIQRASNVHEIRVSFPFGRVQPQRPRLPRRTLELRPILEASPKTVHKNAYCFGNW
jgi:hypothetical protein